VAQQRILKTNAMKNFKNIVLITYDNFPYGGASANLLRYFAMGLARLGNKIDVLLPTGNYYGQNLDHNKNKAGVLEKGVNYKHLGFVHHPRKIAGKIADNMLGIILPFVYLMKKKQRKGVDLIVCYNVGLIKTLMLLLAKKLATKKLVIILPEFYEKPSERFFSIKLFKWYSFYFSMKYLLRHADGFIVLSHYLKDFVANRVRGKKPIMIMPNLIDLLRFERKGIKPFKKEKITIGYIGTPTRKDGVMDLMQSFSKLNKKYPQTHLLIIGDITNGKTLIPHLKEHAEKLDVSDNISFTGLVSYEKVPDLLHSCQILALTRPNGVFAEAGFPTKLGEYFACKKPVVITDIGDMPRYFINEKHVMLVEAEDIESITLGFEKLIINKYLIEQLPKNAFEWMMGNLSYIEATERVDQFLTFVLKDREPLR
jgi:glycosyltransferase involved in cell wall biosynthesis